MTYKLPAYAGLFLFLGMVFFNVSSWIMAHTSTNQPSSFTLVAHRGNSAEAPENTLAAFLQAIDLGVDCIEMDLHMTEDGVPVVLHDKFLFRTTNDPEERRVASVPFDEIRKLDAGTWFAPQYQGEKIPALAEVLELPRGNIALMLELKEVPDEDSFAEHIVEVLHQHRVDAAHLGPIYIASSYYSLLKKIYSLDSKTTIMPIVDTEEELVEALSMGAPMLAMRYSLVNEERVRDFHEKGIRVWCWTVDNANRARELIDWGADGIITNTPRPFLTWRSPA